jgi:hypothetical protein
LTPLWVLVSKNDLASQNYSFFRWLSPFSSIRCATFWFSSAAFGTDGQSIEVIVNFFRQYHHCSVEKDRESFLLYNFATALVCLRMPVLILSFMQDLDLNKPCVHACLVGRNASQG